MAEFASKRPNKLTHSSYEEIVDGGYLVLINKKEGTTAVFLSYRMRRGSGVLLPVFLRMRDVGVADASYRIVDNSALFARGLATPTTPTCLEYN